ncbi:MAG: hypothetical protein GPJ51_09495 [Candidatus Heimdallarchaeota archaeon]|nr:hypothetical protein [Candidatus Heimdallarchaeota archaeon]
MSTKKLQHLKNRIAPPFHKILVVLILFLSSIVSTPILIGGAYSASSNTTPSFVMAEEQLLLFQEKFDIIVGKADSIIASLELDGGLLQTPLDLSRSELTYVNQIDFIVANQSSFSKIWTNPLWKYPDGLVIKLTLRTQNYERIKAIYQFVNSVVQQFYNISLGVFNIQNPSLVDTVLYLVAPISYSQALILFDAIFKSDYQEENGNSVGIIEDMLIESPTVYAFGFSLVKRLGIITRIIRTAVVAQENKIQTIGNQRIFDLSLSLHSSLIPKTNAFVSKFSFSMPFLANVTSVSPPPDNVGGSTTGSFEWVLKFFSTIVHDSFNPEIIYYPFSYDEFVFPRIAVSNSYSDFLLENDGILNMTYEIENTGTDTANDTTIIFPIPGDLELFIQEGLEVPVLHDDLQINESFNSGVTLDIQYSMHNFQIFILDIRGWYENTTTLSLERWLDNTTLEINEYVTIDSTNGLSEDLYNAVLARISPILDIGILKIAANWSYYEPLINEQLQLAVNDAYNIVFNEFYKNKTLFQFSSTDFSYKNSTMFGGYLECKIPDLDVNESYEVFWSITDIPTSADRFGFFSVFPASTILEDYTVFQTVECDYKTLMLALFTSLNSAGRFLSIYDSITDSFVSLGSRYQYFDSSGRDYYGLTNGLNFQLGDDEAVLESILNINGTTYRVGEIVPFTLEINNLGTTGAYNIHVDIVNLRLNYLWLPTDMSVVKSFDIDAIEVGETINQEFSINANSYIGLNTYVAVISFISDLNQPAEQIYVPWIDATVPWIYGGETVNLLTSTLTFGILFPPISLENVLRPSFPVPEIVVASDYTLHENDRSMYIEYEIENTGLSPTEVRISQMFGKETAEIDEINCTIILENDDEQILSPVITSRADFILISYTNTTLYPGDRIVIRIQLSDLAEDFIIPPIIINYDSIYEIRPTDFQSTEIQSDSSTQDIMNLSIKTSPANVSESDQNKFLWISFSPVIKINLPFSEKYSEITFSSLPWLYTLISTGALAGVLVIVIFISRFRK